MGKTLIYSDPHFGHGRIIGYCNRPWWRVAKPAELSKSHHLAKVARRAGTTRGAGFNGMSWDFDPAGDIWVVPNVDEMEDVLVERWNEKVGPDDRVLCLGDMFYWHLSVEECTRIRRRLNGHINLVRGNHDQGRDKELTPAVVALFGDDVPHALRLMIDGVSVLMYHYGPRSWGRTLKATAKHWRRITQDYAGHMIGGLPDIFLHGHSHPRPTDPHVFGELRYEIKCQDAVLVPTVDMSCDAWDFTPATIEEIQMRLHAATTAPPF